MQFLESRGIGVQKMAPPMARSGVAGGVDSAIGDAKAPILTDRLRLKILSTDDCSADMAEKGLGRGWSSISEVLPFPDLSQIEEPQGSRRRAARPFYRLSSCTNRLDASLMAVACGIGRAHGPGHRRHGNGR